jgi:hypothetical protein
MADGQIERLVVDSAGSAELQARVCPFEGLCRSTTPSGLVRGVRESPLIARTAPVSGVGTTQKESPETDDATVVEGREQATLGATPKSRPEPAGSASRAGESFVGFQLPADAEVEVHSWWSHQRQVAGRETGTAAGWVAANGPACCPKAFRESRALSCVTVSLPARTLAGCEFGRKWRAP